MKTQKKKVRKRALIGPEPKYKVEEQLERRAIILRCFERGMYSNTEILHVLSKNKHDIGERTLDKDRAAVREEIKARYADRSGEIINDILFELDAVSKQLQETANGEMGGTKVQALAQKRDTLLAKAKLLGLVVEKQEHSGSMTNFNVNKEAGPDDFAGVKHALQKAKIDADGNPIPSSTSHEDEEG